MDLNNSEKSVRCTLQINRTSPFWISSGVKGPTNRSFRLVRQLAMNLKTQDVTPVNRVQLNQFTGFRFHVGFLETGIEIKFCGCEIMKVFLNSVLTSEPSSILICRQSFSAFKRNRGPFQQSWFSTKLRALNPRE